MGVLIDTSLLIEIERGRVEPDVVAEESAISVITVSELLHGVHRATGAHRIRRRATVDRILDQFSVVDITDRVAHVHAEVWAELERTGTSVGNHDMWIGATALTHGLGVITRNPRDFERVPGLRVVTA